MSKNKSTTITISTSDAEPGAPATLGATESIGPSATPLASPDRPAIPRHACVIPLDDDAPVCGELVELNGMPVDAGTDDDR